MHANRATDAAAIDRWVRAAAERRPLDPGRPGRRARSPRRGRRPPLSCGRFRLAIVCAALAACRLAGTAALAQEGEPAEPQRQYRWLLIAAPGTTSGGPASDIERAMRAAGFGQTSYGFFGPPVDHPFSRTGNGIIGPNWMLAAHRSVAPRLLVGVTVSDAPMGYTSGFKGPYLWLDLQYSVATLAPTLSYELSKAVRLGAGPAVYRTEVRQERSGGGFLATQSATKVGALAELGVSLPADSRVCVALSLQYRLVGHVTIGPFESTVGQYSATRPASSVSFDHFFFGVGVGVRL